jgi:hypothetical protein
VRAKINQPSEVPDIGDKEETVNAEQGLALKDDQVSTKENQPEQETVVSEEINQLADFPETVTVDAADLVGEAKANQESFVRESKVSVTAQSNLPSQGYYTYSQRIEVKNEPSASAPVAFYANAGDRVFYDQILTRDGYQWISYNSYSGQRRYAAISKFQSLLAIPEKSMDGYVCPQHQQNTRLTQSNLVILSLFVRNIDEWLDQFYLLYPLGIHFCFSSVSLHHFNKCFFG